MSFRYNFRISGLLFRVESSRELKIPECFKAFLTNDIPAREADILIEIYFKTKSFENGVQELVPNVFLLNEQIFVRYLWRGEKYIIRKDSVGRGDPCQIFIPKEFAEEFCKNGNWLNYLAFERMIVPFNRFLIHASAVIYEGKAYVFTAKSGGGKSTHAGIWEKCFGAKILNGDKVLIELRENGAVAHGSPVAGSSGIYSNDSAPIAAVFLLKKSLSNQIVPMSGRAAFLTLYGEAIKSVWDTQFNICILEMAELLQKHSPMYLLECIPDKTSVECVLKKQGEIIARRRDV